MKIFKTVITLSILSLFLLCSFGAKAENDSTVYGPLLEIQVYNSGVLQSGGSSTQSAEDLAAGKITFKLIASDSHTGAAVVVSFWDRTSISSYKADETSITSGAGLFGVSGTPNPAAKNEYDGSVSLTSGDGINGYYGIISGRANVNGEYTNYAKYKLIISQNTIVVPPTVATPTVETPLVQRVIQTVSNRVTNAYDAIANITAERTPAAVSITSVAVTGLSSLIYSLGLLGLKRRRKTWGKIINLESSLPISNVKVSLFAAGDEKKLIATTLSNKLGDYYFKKPAAGQYLLEFSKGNYKIVTDSKYNDPSKSFQISDVEPFLLATVMEQVKKVSVTSRQYGLSAILSIASLVIVILGSAILLDEYFYKHGNVATYGLIFVAILILNLITIDRFSRRHYIA